ncbi:MAG TPA: hypothetical protein D7H95_06630 [Candidatus Poseidoniales archaeon]|nr:MAG TPA: hypothetical protein D7H95_06630 [Candidatus Poseidoniales archaeon]
MLLTQKYVIISITFLTKSELPWVEGFSRSQSLRLHVSRGWRLSSSGDSAANAVLNYASNLATHLPYIKVPDYKGGSKQRTAWEKGSILLDLDHPIWYPVEGTL